MGSRDADIDFTFTCPVTVRAVLAALSGAGWSAAMSPGGVSYMINDADDMYDWYDSDGTPDGIGGALALLDAPENQPYTVAVNVFHQEAGTGGMFMFMAGRTDVGFVPTMNRRHVPSAPEFTDLAWYLHALVPALATAGLEGYEATERRH